MHESVYEWVGRKVAELGLAGQSCLDVGSYALPDSQKIRDLFTGDFMGIDEREGPNVDHVWPAQRAGSVGAFPVVVCTEVLEHVEDPFEAVLGLWGAMTRSGHLLLTCRGFDERGTYPPHDFPRDYWRFGRESFKALLPPRLFDSVSVEADPQFPGWFVHAQRDAPS